VRRGGRAGVTESLTMRQLLTVWAPARLPRSADRFMTNWPGPVIVGNWETPQLYCPTAAYASRVGRLVVRCGSMPSNAP